MYMWRIKVLCKCCMQLWDLANFFFFFFCGRIILVDNTVCLRGACSPVQSVQRNWITDSRDGHKHAYFVRKWVPEDDNGKLLLKHIHLISSHTCSWTKSVTRVRWWTHLKLLPHFSWPTVLTWITRDQWWYIREIQSQLATMFVPWAVKNINVIWLLMMPV